MSDAPGASVDIASGQRFAFGANWQRYSRLIDQDTVAAAIGDIATKLGTRDLTGLRFLDVGAGSGLSSLAARRMGARVVSFDYDPDAVECVRRVRAAHDPDAGDDWEVRQGSVLDQAFLASLPPVDIVYSWGVLHHTGDLWTAVDNCVALVPPGGRLFISLYNDQGLASRTWTRVKRSYVTAGPRGKRAIVTGADWYFKARSAFGAALTAGATRDPRAGVAAYRAAQSDDRPRGMDRRHDLVDWVGGYPFEVSRPDDVFRFLRDRGLVLDDLVTCGGGLGCNVFVASRPPLPAAAGPDLRDQSGRDRDRVEV